MLYYQAPTDEIFEETKAKAMEVWRQYSNTYGYVTEKIDAIKDLPNVRDNFMYLVSMFDLPNQIKLSDLLSDQAREAIMDRLLDGGGILEYIVFKLGKKYNQNGKE